MKIRPSIFGALFWGIIISAVADPAVVYDKTPLPPGPILKEPPGFAEWQITFSYAKPAGAQGGAPAAPSMWEAHLPKMLTITQTKPLWHSVFVDASGVKSETWFDGTVRYQQGRSPSEVVPVVTNVPGGQALKTYFSNGKSFPEVEWISPDNYLGTQKGTTYWVFQESQKGPMCWVDSSTHYPVRWQKDNETRDFQFLPAPTGLLTMPPNVASLSQGLKKLDDLSHAAPPHL